MFSGHGYKTARSLACMLHERPIALFQGILVPFCILNNSLSVFLLSFLMQPSSECCIKLAIASVAQSTAFPHSSHKPVPKFYKRYGQVCHSNSPSFWYQFFFSFIICLAVTKNHVISMRSRLWERTFIGLMVSRWREILAVAEWSSCLQYIRSQEGERNGYCGPIHSHSLSPFLCILGCCHSHSLEATSQTHLELCHLDDSTSCHLGRLPQIYTFMQLPLSSCLHHFQRVFSKRNTKKQNAKNQHHTQLETTCYP